MPASCHRAGAGAHARDRIGSVREIDYTGARERLDAALRAIEPWDAAESQDRADARAWVRSGAPIWRTAKLATPPKHLVAYFVLVDRSDRSCLLVDHRLAQLWLPTGGHVEPGEDPASATTTSSTPPPPATGGPMFLARALSA